MESNPNALQTQAVQDPSTLNNEMVWIPGGRFLMGSNKHYPEEAPAHYETVNGFWMDKYAVTNEQFARFVSATGHVTVAERPPNPKDYPGQSRKCSSLHRLFFVNWIAPWI